METQLHISTITRLSLSPFALAELQGRLIIVVIYLAFFANPTVFAHLKRVKSVDMLIQYYIEVFYE